MMKRILVALLLAGLLSVPQAMAITRYDVRMDGRQATVNATFELYASPGEEVNYWTTSFILPPGARALSLSDSLGPISNYTLLSGKLAFATNKGPAKNREVVAVLFALDNAAGAEFGPSVLNLSLAGFEDIRPDVPDEETFARITVPEGIISSAASFGFVSQVSGTEISFAGKGPVALAVIYGAGQKRYQHYLEWGSADLSAANDLFGIVPAVIGLAPPSERFAVAVLPSGAYDAKVNDWSNGNHRQGLLLLRDPGANNSAPTLLHETAHGIAEQAMRWNKAGVSWFDEGVAKYVEFLLGKKRRERLPELFGRPVVWTEGNYQYTLPPRFTPDDLLEYYQSGQRFMKSWNSDDPATREFGYAFSELVIRDAINRNGPAALHPVYAALLKINKTARIPEEHNEIVLGLLDSDFQPCASASRAAFERCLEGLNAMDPPLPKEVTIQNVKYNITIPEIEQPVVAPQKSLFDRIAEILDMIVRWIGTLFGT